MSVLSVDEVLRTNKILPVLVIDEIANAIPTFQALIDGGLRCAEITLRTDAGISAIESCARSFENLCIGAGTVLSATQATQAIQAGAQFIVSPGFDEEVFERTQYFKVPYFPGAVTATEIQKALKNGIKTVKFFPAEQMGGLGTISAISSAISEVDFMPTGGISEENFISYLRHPKIVCIGGSWMAARKDIQERNFDLMKSKIRTAVSMLEAAGI